MRRVIPIEVLALAKAEAKRQRVLTWYQNDARLRQKMIGQAERTLVHLRAAGFGRFYIGKAKVVRAHRAAWMIASQAPIPPGLLVCHSCDNPGCCNPAHLWLGTDDDNNKDRARKGRTVRGKRDEYAISRPLGEAHWSAKLDAARAASIRDDRRSSTIVAGEYGVSVSTVCRIRKGGLWRRALEAKDPGHG